jgi:uncharacterized small protein (DUF1192 family)
VRQIVTDLLESHHQIHDTSFNRSLLKIDRKGFGVLMVELLSETQREVLASDPKTNELLGRGELSERIATNLAGGVDELGSQMKKQATKDAAAWMLGAAKAAIPALLTAAL